MAHLFVICATIVASINKGCWISVPERTRFPRNIWQEISITVVTTPTDIKRPSYAVLRVQVTHINRCVWKLIWLRHFYRDNFIWSTSLLSSSVILLKLWRYFESNDKNWWCKFRGAETSSTTRSSRYFIKIRESLESFMKRFLDEGPFHVWILIASQFWLPSGSLFISVSMWLYISQLRRIQVPAYSTIRYHSSFVHKHLKIIFLLNKKNLMYKLKVLKKVNIVIT